MFEKTFKNIDDILRQEAACASEPGYIEQATWLLFLKYLDALEHGRAIEAGLEGRQYDYIIDASCRWEIWAAPKDKQGKLDHNKASSGPDLIEFVNHKLFPYLRRFKEKASFPNTLEYKIGEIFGAIGNKFQNGHNLRAIIDRIDELRFGLQAEKHELSQQYEGWIKNMDDAGGSGESYTPRPLIRAMVRVLDPNIGETIYDGACGAAGFLCEAFDYLRSGRSLGGAEWLTTGDLETLQESTFYGVERSGLAYAIAVMNMILHGIEAPDIAHADALALDLAAVHDSDRFDVILSNPSFGGMESDEVQQNFPIKTGETAFLFLQHFIGMLKPGGRAAVVVRNTFLSNTDNAAVSLRKHLLLSCNLHTVLDCPAGAFRGAGMRAVVLFFEKPAASRGEGAATKRIWYYQLDPAREADPAAPLSDDDLAEFVEMQKAYADSPKSWSVDTHALGASEECDLSVKNPHGGEAVVHRTPQDILDEIAALDAESAEVLASIRGLL
jgi:type I restriction enzyme M protein